MDRINGIPIWDDATPDRDIFRTDVAYGYVPRDYSVDPEEMFEPPGDMKLHPESDWDGLWEEQQEQKSSLEHIWRVADNGKQPKNLYQNGDPFCFPKGTMVRMADGTQRPIEYVMLNSDVLTAEGNIGRVEQLQTRHYEGDLVKLRTYGHGHLRATPNHPVLTKRGYVPIGEVTQNDSICVPRYAPERSAILLTADHVSGVKRRVKNAVGSAQFKEFAADKSHKGTTHVPDILELTPGVGRIFGLWLAEGHIDYRQSGRPHSVVWTFCLDEKETLAAELIDLLRDELGVHAKVNSVANPNTIQVSFGGVLWCQLFESLLGKYSWGKRLHPDVAGGPKNFLESIFWGWMDGDGHHKGRRGKAYRNGATVSRELALNMYDIANAIGLTPSINPETPQVNRYAKTRRLVWKIQVNPSPSDYRPNYRLDAEESRVWRKVKSVEREKYAGFVYNIGVEGDNSYVAEGLGVHNCWSHSTTNAVQVARAVANEPYEPLSAYMVACLTNNYRVSGGWCGQSAKGIAEFGVCSQKLWPQQNKSRNNDTPEMRADAKKRRIQEEWRDLTRPIHGQRLTWEQCVSCGFNRQPMACDFMWWSHSVCGMGAYRIERGSWGFLILNSHGDNDGDRGFHILRGSKARPDGAIAIRSVTAAG